MKRTVWIIPHTHYDAEVFLVESETLEIGYANLVDALRLLKTHPQFRFTLDQTCYIEPFLRAHPEERDTLQQMIREGRLEIVGGMHSMPDENIPSGESFIRNVLYAKQYCERELGIDVRAGWPIDTFGHHPQIPQLMVKCGFDYSAFQRLMKKGSPSEFYWQGIDGTRLFCHWMARSYVILFGAPGNLPEFTKFIEPRLRVLAQHAVTPHLLAAAGADIAPVEPQLIEMVEAYNQSQDVYELVFATPTDFIRAVRDYQNFPVITDDLNPAFQGCYSARIAVKRWNRQVETLLVNAEKYNAISIALRNAMSADSAQSMAGVGGESRRADLPLAGGVYTDVYRSAGIHPVTHQPKAVQTSKPLHTPQQAKIWDAWRGTLFNHAHDIICGCHVDAVYHNTMDRFKYSQAAGAACLESSLAAITDQIDTRGEGVPVVIYNPLNWERAEAVECSVAFSDTTIFEVKVVDSAGHTVPSDLLQAERYANGSLKKAHLLFIAGAVQKIPALGYEVYRILPAGEEAPATDLATSHPDGGILRFELDHGWLENKFYRMEFDLWSGVITRLYDKVNQWEALSSQKPFGNMIVKERDFGNFWQYNGPCKGDEFYPMNDGVSTGRYPLPAFNDNGADFAHNYLGDGYIRHGKAMVEFTINHPFGSGHYGTRVRLYAGLPRIDIQTTLLNNDERVRYRVAFPTSLPQGKITHEIPFGAIERPQGEFPAQNWMDYSADEHGIALLNRGLPGNNVVDGVMMLSLLKCTALKEGYGEGGGFRLGVPTEEGYEKGKTHTFEYALVTHASDWRAGQAYRHGAEFNQPLYVVKTTKKAGKLPPKMSFIKLSGENVVLSAVKMGETWGDQRAAGDSMIVRFYEAEGRLAEQVVLEPVWSFAKAYEVNLIEKEEKQLDFDGTTNRLTVALGPFEIKTIKMLF